MAHGAGTSGLGLRGLLVVVVLGSSGLDASERCPSLPVTQGRAGAGTLLPAPERLTIASLNIAGDLRTADTLEAWARKRAFDVLLLQEVGNRSQDGAQFAIALSDRLQYHFAYAPAGRIAGTETQGLAILSRLPLLDVRTYPLTYHHLRFRSRCRIAVAASVVTSHGPVRLMNLHLDTRINSQRRLGQLAPLLHVLDGVDGPQIIGGDFNTMNVLWLRTMWPIPFLQHQASAVRAELAGKGFQTPFTGGQATFRFLGLPLKLDWLYLKGLEAVEWNVDSVRFTDHRGVWARVMSRGETMTARQTPGASSHAATACASAQRTDGTKPRGSTLCHVGHGSTRVQ